MIWYDIIWYGMMRYDIICWCLLPSIPKGWLFQRGDGERSQGRRSGLPARVGGQGWRACLLEVRKTFATIYRACMPSWVGGNPLFFGHAFLRWEIPVLLSMPSWGEETRWYYSRACLLEVRKTVITRACLLEARKPIITYTTCLLEARENSITS